MNARTTAVVWCPSCGRPVAGLLAGCDQAACVRLELDEDQQQARRADQ